MTSRDATIVVTLDIGGSAAKASGYDTERQASLGSTAVPYPAGPAGQDAEMFSPDGWWGAAVTALRDLRELIGEPAGRYLGITVSAIRIPFVLLGTDGDAVMPGLLNRDRRAASQVADVTALVGADELYATTGHWPAPEFGLPKLLWVRATYPAAWRATRTVLQLHDWFIYRLAGVLASERSSAAMSQLLSVSTGSWANGLLSALDIPASLLPELRQAGAMAGPLLPEVARATGFAAATPVHIGGGDTHMSALSAQPGPAVADWATSPVVVAGTTTPVIAAMRTSELPGRHHALFPLLLSEHVISGMTAVEANAGPTGMIADVMRDLPDRGSALASELEQRGVLVDAGHDPDGMMLLAGNPFFGPESWESVPKPTVIGLRDWHRGSDVYNACLRSTCYAIASVLDTLVQHSGLSKGPVVATGGMSRSDHWAQHLADTVGAPVIVPPPDRIAGRAGAAIVTGTTGQPVASAEEAPAWRTFTPAADAAAARAASLALYREIYRAAQHETKRRQVAGARTR